MRSAAAAISLGVFLALGGASASTFSQVKLEGSQQLFTVDVDAQPAMQTFSSQYYLGARPYLEPSPSATSFFTQPDAEACKSACLKLPACKYGTFIKGGASAGQCWLSSHTSEQLKPCGVACSSFWKTTVGELREMEFENRTVAYAAMELGASADERGSRDPLIANPERGFAKTLAGFASNFRPLDETHLRELRVADKVTLVNRLFVLDTFTSAPISAQHLRLIADDFTTAQRVGVKLIIRFLYTTQDAPQGPYNDADKATILGHVAQLKPLLRRFKSLIAAAHVGFIGVNGEWRHTTSFGQTDASGAISYPSTGEMADRTAVLIAVLDALHPETFVMVPRPAWKMDFFGDANNDSTRKVGETLAGVYAARTGEYDDCFGNGEHEKRFFLAGDGVPNFLQRDSISTPVGGEPCSGPGGAPVLDKFGFAALHKKQHAHVALALTNCTRALAELEQFHFDFLSAMETESGRSLLDAWRTQGCLDTIKQRLGYRFALVNGTFSSRVPVGGVLEVELYVRNEGLSAPYKARPVNIILRHKKTAQVCVAPLDVDARTWEAGGTYRVNQKLYLHDVENSEEDMVDGQYDMLLFLPDADESLEPYPAYSVRMANEGAFEVFSGYNKLKHALTVKGTANRELLIEQLREARRNNQIPFRCGAHQGSRYTPPIPPRQWEAIPLVSNPSFERVNAFRSGMNAAHNAHGWVPVGTGYKVVTGETVAHSGVHALYVENSAAAREEAAVQHLSTTQHTGAKHTLLARGAAPRYISVGGWSKPKRIAGEGKFLNPPAAYSVYADVNYVDGTNEYSIVAPFERTATGWHHAFVRHELKWRKPIQSVDLFARLSDEEGGAFFDDLHVGFSDSLADPDTTISCLRGSFPVDNNHCEICPAGEACSRMGRRTRCTQGTFSLQGQDACAACPTCHGHDNLSPICAKNTGMCLCKEGWQGISCQYTVALESSQAGAKAMDYARCKNMNCSYDMHNLTSSEFFTERGLDKHMRVVHGDKSERVQHLCKYDKEIEHCECFCRQPVAPTLINPWVLTENAPRDMARPGKVLKPANPGLVAALAEQATP
jgi:hypothetical protein